MCARSVLDGRLVLVFDGEGGVGVDGDASGEGVEGCCVEGDDAVEVGDGCFECAQLCVEAFALIFVSSSHAGFDPACEGSKWGQGLIPLFDSTFLHASPQNRWFPPPSRRCAAPYGENWHTIRIVR